MAPPSDLTLAMLEANVGSAGSMDSIASCLLKIVEDDHLCNLSVGEAMV